MIDFPLFGVIPELPIGSKIFLSTSAFAVIFLLFVQEWSVRIWLFLIFGLLGLLPIVFAIDFAIDRFGPTNRAYEDMDRDGSLYLIFGGLFGGLASRFFKSITLRARIRLQNQQNERQIK
jgi:hypothetical protein